VQDLGGNGHCQAIACDPEIFLDGQQEARFEAE